MVFYFVANFSRIIPRKLFKVAGIWGVLVVFVSQIYSRIIPRELVKVPGVWGVVFW